jgi:hypothetical protein
MDSGIKKDHCFRDSSKYNKNILFTRLIKKE